MNPGSSIQLFSGGVFDPLNPDPEKIRIDDIAHALARQNRFLGHGERYSVAEHSVHVSLACDPEDAFWGLMHDAPEFALGDWPTPLKRSPLGKEYILAERVLMDAVCDRFGMARDEPVSVSRADKAMLERERKRAFANSTPESEAFWAAWKEELPTMDESDLPDYCEPQFWAPELAEMLFLERYTLLGGQR